MSIFTFYLMIIVFFCMTYAPIYGIMYIYLLVYYLLLHAWHAVLPGSSSQLATVYQYTLLIPDALQTPVVLFFIIIFHSKLLLL